MHRIKTEELDTAEIAEISWMFDDKDVNIHYVVCTVQIWSLFRSRKNSHSVATRGEVSSNGFHIPLRIFQNFQI